MMTAERKCAITFASTDEACPHCWDDASLFVPPPGAAIHKQECAYCPRTAEHYEGIYVCLKCFEGLCGEHVTKHATLRRHALYLIHKQTFVEPEKVTSVEQLGIVPPPALATSMVCVDCQVSLPEGCGLSEEVVIGVKAGLAPEIQSLMAANDAIVNAVRCKHCTPGAVVQSDEPSRIFGPQRPPEPTPNCMTEGCDCKANNWMCLVCGFIGCPRAEAGGHQHALLHFMMTGHPLAVKLGTVTPLGADVHCYSCDDEVLPDDLRQLLLGLGVDAMKSVKTSKTLSEMMIDHTLKHDFSAITEQGADLVPAYGPSLTGLKNFGNTCYMAAVLQFVSAMPSVGRRFVNGVLSSHIASCTANDPHTCYGCQMEKLFKGLHSGEFAWPYESARDRDRLNGITPMSFKKFIAAGHVDFSTSQMQDAGEFLGYLVSQMARREAALRRSFTGESISEESAAELDPLGALEFKIIEREQCNSCLTSMYSESVYPMLTLKIPLVPPLPADGTPVAQSEEERERSRPRCTLDDCLSAFLLPSVYQRACGHCHRNDAQYSAMSRLGSFPEFLVIQVARQIFDPKTGQPRKLDCYIDAPDVIDVARIRGSGPQAGETIVRTLSDPAKTTQPEPDPVALASLLSIGIPQSGALWALSQSGNNAERAVDFYFSHPEGPPENTESPASLHNHLKDGASQYKLCGLISHIGHSVFTGHWVAHLRKNDRWYIFNDEKVAESQCPPRLLASLYVYQRADSM